MNKGVAEMFLDLTKGLYYDDDDGGDDNIRYFQNY